MGRLIKRLLPVPVLMFLKNLIHNMRYYMYDRKNVIQVKITELFPPEALHSLYAGGCITYQYIEAYLGNDSERYEWLRQLYSRAQHKDALIHNPVRFNALIESFQKKGFNKRYPIWINSDNEFVSGGHRLALCLYFRADPWVKVVDRPARAQINDEDFFEVMGFGNDVKELVYLTRGILVDKFQNSMSNTE